jgi:hypothetical protein
VSSLVAYLDEQTQVGGINKGIKTGELSFGVGHYKQLSSGECEVWGLCDPPLPLAFCISSFAHRPPLRDDDVFRENLIGIL